MISFGLKNFRHFSENGRCVNHLYHSKESDILLVCWEPFQESSYHDHGDSESIVYILEGSVKVISQGVEKVFQKGEVIITPVGEKHKMINDSDQRLVSYHIYTPGLKTPISNPYNVLF